MANLTRGRVIVIALGVAFLATTWGCKPAASGFANDGSPGTGGQNRADAAMPDLASTGSGGVPGTAGAGGESGGAPLVNVQTTLAVRDWAVVQVYTVRLTAQCAGAKQEPGANS